MDLPDLPATAQDTRTWRVGTNYGLHFYAVNSHGRDEPLGTALNPKIARQIVAEHALCTAPYADDEHQGGSWVQALGELMGERMRLLRELSEMRAERDRWRVEADRASGLIDGPRVWRRRTACPDGATVVHDSEGTVWREQSDRQWLADVDGATPGRWEDLVRVYGPITEGLPKVKDEGD